jgi:hypothetical protein
MANVTVRHIIHAVGELSAVVVIDPIGFAVAHRYNQGDNRAKQQYRLGKRKG